MDAERCDPEIFKDGKAICVFAESSKKLIELWVRIVARDSKQRVDWHYAGGRVVVKFIGSRAKVKAEIDRLLSILALGNFTWVA